MNEKVSQFLDSICVQIKYKPAHQDIRDELAIHIDELTEAFLTDTQNEEAAIDMAIAAMGDGSEIGKQLNKRHKMETEWSLIGLTGVIAVIGGIVMYTSSHFNTYQAVNFKQYLFFAVLGAAVMAGLYFFDYTKLKKMAWPLYLLSIVFLMSRLTYGGAQRWIVFFGSAAITSEFTTILFLISFVGFIDSARGKGIAVIWKLCTLAALSVFPIILQPKLTQAITLLIGYAVLIIAAIVKKHFGAIGKRSYILFGAATCLCGVMFTGVIFSSRYRIDRLTSFITRGRDPSGMGYSQAMADKWLSASRLFGTTPMTMNGHGVDAILPGVTTDYVLINVFVTLGRIVGIALIAVIAAYIGRMFITTRKIKNDYGFYLSLAACTVLAAQFTTGILMNFNFFPPSSVYIPFLSYGGIGYINSMALIGLVLSVWRRNNLIQSPLKMNADNVYGHQKIFHTAEQDSANGSTQNTAADM